MTTLAIIISVLGPILALVGTVLTVRAAKADAREKFVISQLNALMKDREFLYRSAIENRARITRLESNGRVKDDYISDLRQHITEEKPPPPPDYPRELLR